MIRKAIENWLTNTREREYQLPFCQVLSSQGHRILHVSAHGPGEHGKDIITIAPDGTPCAYQLKTGDIKTVEWRSYQGEVIELVKARIRHPSIEKKRKLHRSYLVANGRLSQDVKDSINMQNEDYSGVWSHLDTIEFEELLFEFEQAQGRFYPTELRDTRLFLELLLSDGHEHLPVERYSQFLTTMLPLEEVEATAATRKKHTAAKRMQKTDCMRAVVSSMLMSSYIGQQYALDQNHFALVNMWVVFSAHVLAVAERYALEDKYWLSTYQLTLIAIETSFVDAIGEIEEMAEDVHGIVEGLPLTDFCCLRPRLLEMAGYLSAYALFRKISGLDDWRLPVLDTLLERFGRSFLVTNNRLPYGEWAIPLQLLIAFYMEWSGKIREASALVAAVMGLLLAAGKREGLPNPYYSAETCLQHQLGLKPIEESFEGRSYHLQSLTEWLSRRLWRQHVRSVWPGISHMQFCEFVPQEKWAYFLWHCQNGEEKSWFPNQTQSWAELRKDYADAECPHNLQRFPEFLPLFLAAYPHRLTPAFSWRMDKILK